MSKVAIVTDSNSGITQEQGKQMGISVIPMPFEINGKQYFEDINLSQKEFYELLEEGAEISTSQPSPEVVLNLWDKLLEEYDEVVHIPMSSGLSGSCGTAMGLALDYEGKVQVVNNQRISVTLRQSVLDAIELAKNGKTAIQIKEILEKEKFMSSIYITLDTLKYLKKGGRVTPAAAALASLLKIKPVLQIQGEKLDAFAKARTVKQAKSIMMESIRKDIDERFGEKVYIQIAYTKNIEAALEFKKEVEAYFPDYETYMDPLSLSVSCHIGPGALAVAVTKHIPEE